MARDFLAASGSGVPVESLFSTAVDILDPKRRNLSENRITQLVCLKEWLKSEYGPKENFDYNSFKLKVFGSNDDDDE